jgi:hypothetical protein
MACRCGPAGFDRRGPRMTIRELQDSRHPPFSLGWNNSTLGCCHNRCAWQPIRSIQPTPSCRQGKPELAAMQEAPTGHSADCVLFRVSDCHGRERGRGDVTLPRPLRQRGRAAASLSACWGTRPCVLCTGSGTSPPPKSTDIPVALRQICRVDRNSRNAPKVYGASPFPPSLRSRTATSAPLSGCSLAKPKFRGASCAPRSTKCSSLPTS